ncbi:PAS domain S-box protein [Dethiobacter alkaliphilus]|nr:PAS domain S-box protein [Dethiobacter alkaliphilus]
MVYQNGEMARNDDGVPVLDCMCGRVIREDLEETLVSLSASGAFYTGDINQLCSELGKKNIDFNVRNYCGAEGYRSIALIPLRAQDEIVGLLQLNDRKPHKFSEDNIEFLNLAGKSIGTALTRFRAEQAHRRSEMLLDEIIQKAQDGFSLTTPEGRVIIYNNAMEEISGYTREEVDRHGWYYLIFPVEEDRKLAIQKARLAIAGKLEHYELQITCKDGTKKPVILSLTPLEIDGQTFNFTVMIDLFKKYKTEDMF